MDAQPTSYFFSGFTLDLTDRRLSRDGQDVALGSRYFDALTLLVQNAGSLVPKNRFMDEVWGGIPVTDEALTQCIRTLRRALGDDAANPALIATVPKHGYRFLVIPETHGSGPLPPGQWTGGRLAGGATIGGAIAGLLGGCFYGLAGTDGGSGAVLVVIALVGALGIMAGAGVGIGMGLASASSGPDWRRLMAGGAVGGLFVGALGQILGRDGVAALTGATLAPTTGLLEGAILGAAAGLSGFLAMRSRPALAGGLGSAIGALAGLAVALSDGKLLGTSLLALESRFPASHLDIGNIGRMLGRGGFDAPLIVPTTMIESAVFVSCVGIAIAASRDHGK